MLNRSKYFFILLFLLSSCGETGQSIKRGLTGEKVASTDQFLVKKKDPLVLPPNFDTLPMPRPAGNEDDEQSVVESLISESNITQDEEETSKIQKKLEESILKNIGNN